MRPPIPTRPLIVRDDAGVRRLASRRFGRIERNVVRCPGDGEPHAARARVVLPPGSHVAIECQHRTPPHGHECGIWLELLHDAQGAPIAVEVHRDEALAIEAAQMDEAAVRVYLGLGAREAVA
jgi:hypothetical protein